MCTSNTAGLAAPLCGANAVQATNITMRVCGDSTLNLYPRGKQVGNTLSHDHGYRKMKMKAESGARFVTIVVQASDLLANDLDMEPASDSILVIVWNGNDFAGGKKFEVISELWYTAVANLIELRRFWPRVVILSCSDHKRWGCSAKMGRLHAPEHCIPEGPELSGVADVAVR